MKKYLRTGIFGLALAALVSGTGCHKKKDDGSTPPSTPSSSTDTNTIAAINAAWAETCYDDFATLGDQAWNGTLNAFRSGVPLSPFCACAGMVWDTANPGDADTMTVNFGTVDCLCSDGRFRRGSVQIVYPGGSNYPDSGNVISFYPDHYFVDRSNVGGSVVITNRGHISRYRTCDLAINGIIVLNNNAGTITYNASRTRKLILGENPNGTINWSMAKFGFTGSASGTMEDGTAFTATVVNQEVRDMSGVGYIKFNLQGTLNITPSGKTVRHIDFGNGAADDTGTITIGSFSRTFQML